MVEKYMSIITNFGCHGECPYCIVKKNGINVPKTTVEGLNNLIDEVKKNQCNIVSVSGGGDPLHNYEKHTDYYSKLIDLLVENNIPLEMHTSYIENGFPIGGCHRVVYHLRDSEDLFKIKRWGREKVRVVFVVTANYTITDLIRISRIVDTSSEIDEISFRQLVGENYETKYYHHDILQWGHKEGLWHYIEQNDYNLYYVNGEVHSKFSEISNAA